MSIQLSNNTAQIVRDSGEQPDIQTSTAGQGLAMSDVERRRLITERGNMIALAAMGVVMLGIAWMGYDVRKNRRKDSLAKLKQKD